MTAAGSYQLGVDLGTTYTAASVARDGRVEVVGLGTRSTAIPSVIHAGADGALLHGEAADRRAPAEPERVAREFKRRIGDPTPLLLGGTPYSAEALTGHLLRAVIDKVSELEGGPPERLAVTHPANWGPYKLDLFGQGIRLVDAALAVTLTEPEAAAIAYAANERVEPGSVIAVYDLGGGTFDAAVLRKTTRGFEILGQPEGIERLGGIDFDQAVVGHVREVLGDALDDLDAADPAVLAALTRLRRECTEAKEALSSDTEATIPVVLPGVQTQVRLTRGEFERMVRPTLTATVDALRRALESAHVTPGQVTSVLLVGGSSRIPLVAALVSDALGRPVAVDAHPKHAIAMGAAHAVAPAVTRAAAPTRAAAGGAAAAAGAGTAPGAGAGAVAAMAATGVPSGGAGRGTGHDGSDARGRTGDDAVAAGGAAGAGAGDAAADDVAARGGRVPADGPVHRDDGAPLGLGPRADDDRPDWLSPVQRGRGGRKRRAVLASIAALVLLGALAASAYAMNRADETDSGLEEATGVPQVDEATREQSGGGALPQRTGSGAVGGDGGGAGTGGGTGNTDTDGGDTGVTGDTGGDETAPDPERDTGDGDVPPSEAPAEQAPDGEGEVLDPVAGTGEAPPDGAGDAGPVDGAAVDPGDAGAEQGAGAEEGAGADLSARSPDGNAASESSGVPAAG